MSAQEDTAMQSRIEALEARLLWHSPRWVLRLNARLNGPVPVRDRTTGRYWLCWPPEGAL